MKKLSGLLLLLLLFVSVSCEPAKSEFTQESYIDDIYTVNKHTVSPEFADTSYMVSNMDEYNLATGTRARMVLRYYYDASSGKMPSWSIYHIEEIIPTRPLSALSEIDTLEYSTPFVGLIRYEVYDKFYKPVWVHKNRQNLSVVYSGVEEGAEFAMAVRGVVDNFVELELFAKARNVGNVTTRKLLTFDLAGIKDFISSEQASSLVANDSLKTRVFLKLKDDKGNVRKAEIIGGTFENPFKQ